MYDPFFFVFSVHDDNQVFPVTLRVRAEPIESLMETAPLKLKESLLLKPRVFPPPFCGSAQRFLFAIEEQTSATGAEEPYEFAKTFDWTPIAVPCHRGEDIRAFPLPGPSRRFNRDQMSKEPPLLLSEALRHRSHMVTRDHETRISKSW